jgi:hypothetical protein
VQRRGGAPGTVRARPQAGAWRRVRTVLAKPGVECSPDLPRGLRRVSESTPISRRRVDRHRRCSRRTRARDSIYDKSPDDDDDLLFVLAETTNSLPLYNHLGTPSIDRRKARVMMLLSCSLWCHDASVRGRFTRCCPKHAPLHYPQCPLFTTND